MKITDLRCIAIPSLKGLLVRIDTDEGVYGIGQVGATRHAYVAPQILFYKQFIMGLDPRNVEDVMRRIRRLGAFKPWGSGVSAIEVALWDLAGKAMGQPVHRLLGGKIRDHVRPYMGALPPFVSSEEVPSIGNRPEDYHARALARRKHSHGMTIMKNVVGFHDDQWRARDGMQYGVVYPIVEPTLLLGFSPWNLGQNAGMATPQGVAYAVKCAEAANDALGDNISIALDCGPGWKVPSAIEFTRAIAHLKPVWLEDLLTGDYTPYVGAHLYREVKLNSTVPIHTGEQIYLRQNFMELIESHAVDVLGPDPMDMGGYCRVEVGSRVCRSAWSADSSAWCWRRSLRSHVTHPCLCYDAG
jgi:L-alanine-DL-glutamate epimerase-like enolase superfamily enzyme